MVKNLPKVSRLPSCPTNPSSALKVMKPGDGGRPAR
jgi:hypothetical protein